MTYRNELEEQQEKEGYDPYWDAMDLEPLPPITALEVASAVPPTVSRQEPLALVLSTQTSRDKPDLPASVKDLCVQKIGFYSSELLIELNKDRTKVRIARNLVNVVEALKVHPTLTRNERK